MTTIAFHTLGCKSNQYETDIMKNICSLSGFKIVPFKDNADIYIINTCTVTGNADRKSRNAIRSAKKKNKNSIVIATGCYVEAGNDEVYKIKEADILLKNGNKKNILNYLPKLKIARATACEPPMIRANLMIENGCENFCSYCVVPFVRGKIASKPIDQAVAEARHLVEAGAREIVLTGINLGEYNSNPKSETLNPKQIQSSKSKFTSHVSHLASLIDKLSNIDGLLRIRLSSIEPMYVNDELIKVVTDNPKVCKHLHIPLQSGDDVILKAMNRTYTSNEFIKLVQKIKKQVKDVSVTTDIIVGFPGEDEKAFRNTCKVVNKLQFPRIHVFSYSDRPGTAAIKMINKVSPKIITQRYEKMLEMRDKYMLKFHRSFNKKPMEVLIEHKDGKTGRYEGLTSNYIRVFLDGLPPEARSEATAKGGDDMGDDSLGRIIHFKIKAFRGEHIFASPVLV